MTKRKQNDRAPENLSYPPSPMADSPPLPETPDPIREPGQPRKAPWAWHLAYRYQYDMNPSLAHPFRHLWCRRYDACLTLALRSGWRTFSCAGCEHRDTSRRYGRPDDAFFPARSALVVYKEG